MENPLTAGSGATTPTDGSRAATAIPATPTDPPIAPPRWSATVLILAILSAVACAPLLLATIPTPDSPGTVGLFERVTLSSTKNQSITVRGSDDGLGASSPTDEGGTSEPATAAIAGFIAPAGWLWIENHQSGAFRSADGAALITTEFRTGVEGSIEGDANTDTTGTTSGRNAGAISSQELAESLVYAEVPVGAIALPTLDIDAPHGLAAAAIEFDLAAGDNPSLVVALCSEASVETTACVIARATFGAGDEATQRELQQSFADLIRSVEIVA